MKTTGPFSTLADLQAAYPEQQLFSDGAGRVAVWEPAYSVYVWHVYNARRGCWQPSGSTKRLTNYATPIGSDLPELVRQLFAHVDAEGHPQTRVGGTAEYDVLVPIPASLLRQLRKEIDKPPET